MGGTTTTRAATFLADPSDVSGTQAWAASLTATHREALEVHASFTGPYMHTVSLVAPKDNIIQSAGDPFSIALALTPTLDFEATPTRTEAARAPTRVPFVASGLRQLQDWRTFLFVLADAPPPLYSA